MKRHHTWLTALVTLLLCALGAAGCKEAKGDKIKLPPRPPKAAKTAATATASANATATAGPSDGVTAEVDEDGNIRLTGTTAARQQSAVAAEGRGKLTKMLVHEGDLVKRGQPIARRAGR